MRFFRLKSSGSRCFIWSFSSCPCSTCWSWIWPHSSSVRAAERRWASKWPSCSPSPCCCSFSRTCCRPPRTSCRWSVRFNRDRVFSVLFTDITLTCNVSAPSFQQSTVSPSSPWWGWASWRPCWFPSYSNSMVIVTRRRKDVLMRKRRFSWKQSVTEVRLFKLKISRLSVFLPLFWKYFKKHRYIIVRLKATLTLTLPQYWISLMIAPISSANTKTGSR